jgi:TonB-linked SusC/RagA family outer membrane protein
MLRHLQQFSLLLVLLCSAFSGQAGHAPLATLKGTVIGEKKEPMEGVTVVITEKKNGQKKTTVTDAKGNFLFNNLPAGTVYDVQCSMVGYTPYLQAGYMVKEGITNSLLIQLKQATHTLDDVVVTGYSTQRRTKVTGAVSQISGEVLEDRPSPGLTRLLQGTLPNLNLRMVDGSPIRGASYNVRGTTSIGAGGAALVLIDGVEGNPDFINPNDVESVTVLKDASSAAIYGSRAAFGVVLITTKSAKRDAVKINFSSSYSINQRTITPKLITNGYEWAKNFDESFAGWNDYTSHPTVVNNIFPFSLEYLDRLRQHDENPSLPKVEYNSALGRYEYFGNTDWFKELYKDRIPSTEQSISVSGGSEKANFYLSGRYYFQDGIFNDNTDKFNKYNLRAKGEVAIKPWLKVQNNFELSNYTYTFPMLADRDNQTIWRMMDLLSFPMATIYNPDGTLSHTGVYSGIGAFKAGNNESKTTDVYFRNTVALEAKVLKDQLKLRTDFTYSRETNKEKRVNNFVDYSTAPGVTARLGRSLLQQLSSDRSYMAANFTAEYNRTFNNLHHLKVLGGMNVETAHYEIFNASRDGLLNDQRPDFNLMDGLNYTITGGGNEWAYRGLFYRVNYDFKDRYLIELDGRYDGSSKFPSSQRYGFFPSVSAGWRISGENFMQASRNWLSDWKVRASYGSLGNGNVEPYRYLEQMGVSKMSVILNGVQNNYTQIPAVIPEGLTWERSTTLDVGTDIVLLRNRLQITADWFNRKTTGMFIAGSPLPAVFGATVPYGNYADMSTKGWELTIAWKDRTTLFGSPFEYGFNGSLWDSKSTITRFNNPTRTLSSTYYTGHTVGEIWGYVTDGLFQSQEEIVGHANQDFLQNSNSRKLLPGDVKFVDLNKDGFINQGDNTVDNPGDRKIIGNSSPRYQFGFTLSGRWKGIGLSAFFQGIGKRDWYFAPEAGMFWGLYNRPYGYQSVKMMENYWTEDNPDAYFPRLRGYAANTTTRSLGAPQTRYLQDASYLRFKTLTIDYQLPKAWMQRWKMNSATIFVSMQNLFTISGMFKYTDSIDPEIIENPLGDLLNNSGQGYAYPMLKTTTIGLNINF